MHVVAACAQVVHGAAHETQTVPFWKVPAGHAPTHVAASVQNSGVADCGLHASQVLLSWQVPHTALHA